MSSVEQIEHNLLMSDEDEDCLPKLRVNHTAIVPRQVDDSTPEKRVTTHKGRLLQAGGAWKEV